MVLPSLANPQDENFLSGPPGYTKARESRVADDEGHWKDDLDTTIQQLFIKAYGSF
ncbi:hypothetical protein CK203_110680 [Vitis vinifera]|uniref:Uncharacterized protein n=1 Tax=Vitis vinifera TaxID=29760 RepID=A0A438FDX7_VITVI|nr:hypothetical protein CK203_110680 [Vitis vinifera]